MATTQLGSPYYMAPEVLNGKPYGRKTDVWSYGICMFEYLFGQQPYPSKNYPQLIKNVSKKL
jgi:serine/threonine protein kinase